MQQQNYNQILKIVFTQNWYQINHLLSMVKKVKKINKKVSSNKKRLQISSVQGKYYRI